MATTTTIHTTMGYCIKCRASKLFADPVQVHTKNGVPAIDGHCIDCSTRMYLLGRLK